MTRNEHDSCGKCCCANRQCYFTCTYCLKLDHVKSRQIRKGQLMLVLESQSVKTIQPTLAFPTGRYYRNEQEEKYMLTYSR